MSTLAIANQYAKALLEAASRPGAGLSPEQALDQIGRFDAVLHQSDQLRTVLLSPAVALPAKQRVIARLCASLGCHRLLQNFLEVVTRHRRLPLLAEIAARYQALLDARLGLVRARVSTALPLTAEQSSALESALARVTGGQVRCTYQTDTSLVGGLAVRVGSTVYDGSVRGQLDGLRRRLTE